MFILKKLLSGLLALFILGVITTIALYWYIIDPYLPNVKEIANVSLSTPLRIVTKEGQLISEVGTQKRLLVSYEEIPRNLINAILVTEDQRFFEHGGIDYKGLLRAAFILISTGEKRQGGSTITMQLARNFFLTRERSFLRKFREIFLARRLESVFNKEKILTLYINRVFLGHRSYGFQAAAQTYFGKKLEQLNLAEISLLAGLPKAPSTFNPVSNAKKAKERRNHVLRRLFDEQKISNLQYETSINYPLQSKLFSTDVQVPAGHVAEMVRQEVEKILQNKNFYDKGYTVITTIESTKQLSANASVQKGLLSYIKRHPWKGVQSQISFNFDSLTIDKINRNELIEATQQIENIDGLIRAVIYLSSDKEVRLLTENREQIALSPKDLKWGLSTWESENSQTARLKSIYKQLKQDVAYQLSQNSKETYYMPSAGTLSIIKTESKAFPVGGVVYVKQQKTGKYSLVSKPQTQAALISLDPKDGAILALVGGFNYLNYKFNRVTQAKRQPGSNFKPFLYAAALAKGFTAASIINDAPMSFEDLDTGFIWTPSNFSKKYFGDTRLREALVKSRNLVSVRLLSEIKVNFLIKFMENFGLSREIFLSNKNLSLSLGSAPLTPLEVIRGYSVFANGGYLIEPYLIDRIIDREGNEIYKYIPRMVCYQNCEDSQQNLPIQTVDSDISYIISDILRNAIQSGTGRRARSLKRKDISGKTGTTNEQFDSWFSGFNANIITTVWTGFDQPQGMGKYETGSRAALPIWIDYMKTALKDTEEYIIPKGSNIVSVRISKKNGKVSLNSNPNETLLEIFRIQNAPVVESSDSETDLSNKEINKTLIDKLF